MRGLALHHLLLLTLLTPSEGGDGRRRRLGGFVVSPLARRDLGQYHGASAAAVEGVQVVPHHTALWVQNITTSMAFYSLLGFSEERRFKAGPARAVWLRTQPPLELDDLPAPALAAAHYLELIEVPSHVASKPVNMAELTGGSEGGGGGGGAGGGGRESVLRGMNHLALDVTENCRASGGGLPAFLRRLNTRSETTFDRSVRLVVEPHQRIIGQEVFEVGFIADPDGVLLELLSRNEEPIATDLEPAW